MGKNTRPTESMVRSEADARIEEHSAEAWDAAAAAARDMVAEAGRDGHPDLDRLESIASRIEISALVLSSVEMRYSHHELKTDVFQLGMEEMRRSERLLQAAERIVAAIDGLEARLGKLETKVSMLLMRANFERD
ncbi:MAG: hypothetical protein ACM31L_14700 [Actinomycetota bacterium]